MPAESQYRVKALWQGWQVLSAFHSPREVLRLRDVVRRTGLQRGTAFRLLYTLHECGLVEKPGANEYRLRVQLPAARECRIGYAMNSRDHGFTRHVTRSLTEAAAAAGMELLVLDNHPGARATLKNAERLVEEKVDIAIEFQGDEPLAPVVAEKFLNAGIPLIAVDVPHPGATYFGADNYKAGLLAGRALGKWLKEHWQEEAEEVLLLGFARAGTVVGARLSGIRSGLREALPRMADAPVTELEGNGDFQTSYEAVRAHLRRSRSRRTVIGGINDTSVLAALRAFAEAGRAAHSVAAGQNAEPDAREELRRPGSRLIASVAYFPEKYGPSLIRLSRDILVHKPAPPAVFTQHKVITAQNVDHYYPNDGLLGGEW